jgi:hypothetical protein
MIDVAERVYPYRIGFSTAMSSQFAAPRDRGRRGGPPLRVPEFGRAASRGDRAGERRLGKALGPLAEGTHPRYSLESEATPS